MNTDLTKDDTAFILWCLGYVYSASNELDDAHKQYITKKHDDVLPKIAPLHEMTTKKKKD